jgi:hypothetical protein
LRVNVRVCFLVSVMYTCVLFKRKKRDIRLELAVRLQSIQRKRNLYWCNISHDDKKERKNAKEKKRRTILIYPFVIT